MNVHLTQVCNDCRFHEFPYKAKPPISGYGEQVFECKEDVYDIIQLLIDECKEWNQKGKEFDISKSVSKQLAFFSCPNIVLEKEYQKDIQRYVYCNETGTQAYSGSFGEQPSRWLAKYFILKQAFAQKQKVEIDGRRKNKS